MRTMKTSLERLGIDEVRSLETEMIVGNQKVR